MTRKRHLGFIMIWFALITGCIIGALTWLYLKASNVGVTLVWQTIGSHFPTAVYTVIVCVIGGVAIGFYHRKFGPYPENMGTAVRKVMQDRAYPYWNMPMAIVAALLSILFGGAVGPEAGLVCILISLCFWAKDEFGLARENLQTYAENDPGVGGFRLLGRSLKGLIPPKGGHIVYDVGKVEWSNRLKVGCGLIAALGGLYIYVLFNYLMGRAFTLPHIDGGTVAAKDRLAMILLLVVGIAAGYLYLVLRKLISKAFEFLRGKGLHVLNSVLGGLILGLIGGQIPLTMFSGCADIQTIQNGYMNSLPYMLIIVGVLKLFLTNVCIESEWRGGHFFPLLFAGLSIGYGFAGVLGTNAILSVVVVTGALLGTVLQQPLGALVLAMIFFPRHRLGGLISATCVTGCIPVPATLRMNPDGKAFIPDMKDRIEKRLHTARGETDVLEEMADIVKAEESATPDEVFQSDKAPAKTETNKTKKIFAKKETTQTEEISAKDETNQTEEILTENEANQTEDTAAMNETEKTEE